MSRLGAVASRRLCVAAAVALVLVGVLRVAEARAVAPWRPHKQNAGRAQEDYRLPNDTKPTAYDVALTVHLGQEEGDQFAFEGTIRIDVSVESDTDTITIHNDRLQINTLTVKILGDGVQTINSTSEASGDDRQFFYIKLEETVPAGSQLVVEMDYQGELWDDMYGFYRSYYVQDGVTKWLAVTQFEPTFARRAFPCYDEPGTKAPFTFSFNVPSQFNVLFNTKMATSTDGEVNGMKTVTFMPTPPMSSYLVAFVVSEFSELKNELGSVWARRDVLQDGQLANNVNKPAIDTMAKLVGVPFEKDTIVKMDNVAIPDFSAGAMENWGLATYRERLILWAQNVSDEGNKQTITTTITHELAHQWFGDLVSPRWWDAAWINEGFATFFEYFAAHEFAPTWQLDEQFVVIIMHRALSSDSSASSEPLTSPVGNTAEVMAHFDDITYDKGGSVIRMMQHALGSTIFYNGLKRYITANALGAGSDELVLAGLQEALESAETFPLMPDGKTFSEALWGWITVAGYPLITATRDYEAGTVTLTQKRFLLTEGAEPSTSTWDVPLTFTTGAEGDFSSTETRQWLAADAESAALDVEVAADDWLILNVQQVGFYRVNYDEANWALLATQLQTDHTAIATLNRAHLLDDAFDLARAGVLDYGLALDNTLYLPSEADYSPWYSALDALSFLNTRLQLSEEQELLQTYLKTILANISEKLGYTEVADDSHMTRIFRTLISKWQCSTGVQSCLDYTAQELASLMSDQTNYKVGPDMKSVVYCYGVQQATGTEEWQFLWERYSTTETATEESTILSALGCTTNAELINEYLSKTITPDSGIRSQDASAVFASTYVTPQGIDAAINFLSANFDEIKDFYGGFNVLINVISGIADKLTTEDQLNKLITFVNDNTDKFDSATLAAAQASISAAQGNMAWTDKHRDSIRAWLETHIPARNI